MGKHIEPIERRILFAAVGLDQSYGHGGIATLDLPASGANNTFPVTLALTPAGQAIVGAISGSDFFLTMVNSDGSQNLTFGSKGRVDLGHEIDVPIAIDPK